MEQAGNGQIFRGLRIHLICLSTVLPDQGADGDQVGDAGHRFTLALLAPVQLSRPAEGIGRIKQESPNDRRDGAFCAIPLSSSSLLVPGKGSG
jgi:hypothetical protein